ncbi:54S ribosomal protein L9, mitochondrial [Talaromyces atroroseus]|uniref:Large ribosomal subunit protein uL3m n=1 Tax=Talaromyces atroroseus TaxID=1441469 RepID=A0A225APA2_TALAT|nr:54S ribosomal protein L9, mitochondrial [Talaromyces atroroseus]OKL59118.1 54S ribosomal protein L9, mitochondrial [Talaromyces atroroseus]
MPPRLPHPEALSLNRSGWAAQFLIDTTSKRFFGIRSLTPPKHSRYNAGPDIPVLKSTPAAALERRIKADTMPLRTGLLAIKKGMTGLYDPETGKRTPCTVLQLDRCQVVSHKTMDKHGYFAVQIGSGFKNPERLTNSLVGHFSVNGVAPKRYVHEFRVRDESGLLGIGETLHADWFQVGQFVDARSNTKGKGFAGVMKRHGFHGQDRSHGVSLTHRSMGSAGPSQGGGSRVYPGKKMAGNMGNVQNTLQNLKVLQVDRENGLIVVNGSVSGPKGCLVKLQDALKKPWPKVDAQPKLETVTEES